MSADLLIKNLHVNVEGQEILKGLNLEMNRGRDPCHHGAQRLWARAPWPTP